MISPGKHTRWATEGVKAEGKHENVQLMPFHLGLYSTQYDSDDGVFVAICDLHVVLVQCLLVTRIAQRTPSKWLSRYSFLCLHRIYNDLPALLTHEAISCFLGLGIRSNVPEAAEYEASSLTELPWIFEYLFSVARGD